MPFTRNDLIAFASENLKDLRPFLNPGDIERFVDDAVLQHSQDRPRVVAIERTSDGKVLQRLDTIAEFEPGWARPIVKVEYPKVEDDGPPDGMPSKEWGFHHVPGESAPRLLFRRGNQPPTSAAYILHLNTRHTADSAGTTLRDHEVRAVPWRASSIGALVIGTRTGQATDPAYGDAVNFNDKPNVFVELSREHWKKYATALKFGDIEGPDGEKPRLAAVRRVDWDRDGSPTSNLGMATHDPDLVE